MPLARSFETFVVDEHAGYSLGILVLPSHSIIPSALERLDADPTAGLSTIDAEIIADVPFASALPRILAMMVVQPDLLMQGQWPNIDLAWSGILADQPELAAFAEEASYLAIVPTEMSPIDLQSLASLITQGTSFVAAAQDSPILWIRWAGGVVVVGAALGIAGGLRAGLRDVTYYLVTRLFRVPPYIPSPPNTGQRQRAGQKRPRMHRRPPG